jgi:peptidoglycan/LPS O-acetylase OafA/YrhL
LDGLRGFAAIAVVTTHADVSLGLLPYGSGGFIGVLVFFVLSGYLITAQVWRAAPDWSSYRRFVVRRVQRLGPAVLGLACISGPVMVLWGGQTPWEAARDALVALLQSTAFVWSFAYDVAPQWSPTWSLTVEWSFYLVVPAVLVAARRRGASTVITRNVAGAAAAGVYVVGCLLPAKAFYLLPVANLGVMLAGAALALDHLCPRARRSADPVRAVAALAMLLTLVVLPGSTLAWTYRVVMPAVTVAAVVVIHGCRLPGPATKLLTRRPLTALGLRAYSLYLWHMPVLWLVWVNTRGMSPWLQAAVALAALVPVVVASYHWLERPWLRARAGAARLEQQPRRQTTAVAA